MFKQSNSDNFGTLVLSHYKFLVDEFDFSMVKENDWTYKFESPTTRIIIFLERAINLVVEIEPIGESARHLLRQNVLPSKLDVIALSMCLDLDLKYKIEKMSPTGVTTNVPVEIEKRALLLRKYCLEILIGNHNNWPQFMECISKRAREFLDIL